jgi:hypothetical protein
MDGLLDSVDAIVENRQRPKSAIKGRNEGQFGA